MNCEDIPDKTSLEAALKEAQSQGLPLDWTVVLNVSFCDNPFTSISPLSQILEMV